MPTANYYYIFFHFEKESKLFGSRKQIHFVSFASDAFHFYLQINKLAFGDDLLYRLRFKPILILYTLKSAAISMPITVTIIVIIIFSFFFFVLFFASSSTRWAQVYLMQILGTWFGRLWKSRFHNGIFFLFQYY